MQGGDNGGMGGFGGITGDDGFGGFSDSSVSDPSSVFGDADFSDFGSETGLNFGDASFGGFSDASMSDMGGDMGEMGVDAQGMMGDPFGEDNGLGKFGKGLLGFLGNKGIAATMNAIGLPGFQGPLGMAVAGGKGPGQAGQSFGSTAGGMLGTAVAGPIGGVLGGMLGGAIGNSALGGVTANAGMNGAPSANGENGATGMQWGDLATGLAGLYAGNREKNQYNDQINSLQSIYSPGGQYAQALRNQLQRRDAAAGRRSQHGPREAQLMAALAQSQAQTMSSPGMVNMMKQRGIAQNQGLGTVLSLLQKSGLGQRAMTGLGDMFSGMFGGGQSTGFDQMPQVSLGGGGSDLGQNFFDDGSDMFSGWEG
jgi:hypothetical protein